MSEMSSGDDHGPGRYEIRLTGHLGPRWAAWFDGFTITTQDDGTTVVSGDVVDQSALHGLLNRIRDVGLPLVSVVRVAAEPAPPTTSETTH